MLMIEVLSGLNLYMEVTEVKQRGLNILSIFAIYPVMHTGVIVGLIKGTKR